jgi:ribosomal protein S12 methylthiotransferase accessory factor
MSRRAIRLRSRSRSDLHQTLAAVESLVDPEFGIIQSLEFSVPRHDDPQFAHCHAALPDLARVTGRAGTRSAEGTGLTCDVAAAKAVGEAVERYCSEFCDPREVTRAPYRRVQADATDPRRFVTFHPEQYRAPGFPYAEVSADTVIGWVAGYSLTRRRDTLVPATLVHRGYPRLAGESFEAMPVSGYACGNTLEEAVLGAICEVVERDAFMVCWYNDLPVPAFDLSAVRTTAARQTIDRYHAAPVTLRCANLTTDIGIPAVLALMTCSEPGWPAAVVATAAHVDTEQAIVRALQELAANHGCVRGCLEGASRPIPRNPEEVVSMEDHGLFYAAPERFPALEGWIRPRAWLRPAEVETRASDDVLENIEHCVERLAAADLEAIAVDLTTEDVASLGFHVVKVLVPGAQPIDFGMGRRHLGGRRIYEAPQRMGYRDRPTLPAEINPLPHPFP